MFSGVLIATISGEEQSFQFAGFSKDDKLLVTVGKVCNNEDINTLNCNFISCIKIWDALTGEFLFKLPNINYTIEFVDFIQNNKALITSSGEGVVNIWSLERNELLGTLTGHTSALNEVVTCDNSDILATISTDDSIYVWNINNMKLLNGFTGKNIEFSSTGDTIFVDNKLMQVIDNKAIDTFKYAFFVGFIQNSKYYYCTDESCVRVYKSKTNKLLHGFKGQLCTFINKEKQLLTSPYRDFALKLWDVESGKLIHSYEHGGPVMSIYFNQDRNIMLTTCEDKIIRLWDLNSGQLISNLVGHDSYITAIEWNEMDGRVISTDENNRTILWDIKSNDIIVEWVLIDNSLLQFTEDNYYYGSKSAVENIYWIVNHHQIYPFEQFDLKYNRPDIVLARLGYASPELIDAYYRAYQKRLKKMGFTEEQLSG
ncbi:MAG: hypothetical protein KBB11_09080 [Bacteroidales bacterium]|nr:hypothetical protein [Bacteroidales bacterium]